MSSTMPLQSLSSPSQTSGEGLQQYPPAVEATQV